MMAVIQLTLIIVQPYAEASWLFILF